MSAHVPSCGCLQTRRPPLMSYGYSHAGGYAASRHSPLPQQLKSAQEAGCAHPARVRGDLQVVEASRRRGSLPKEARVPDGFVDYETMLLLRPDLSEEERDIELAKFEAFLERQSARDINAIVRGVQHLAYPIKGFWEGIYVLYTYTARRSTSVAVQSLLAKPPVGEEKRVLRFATFCM